MNRLSNFINGEFVPPVSGQYFPKIDPATGKPCSEVPDSDERDVAAAVVAAERAFPKWSKTPAAERCRVLLRIADLIEQNVERFALAECVDTGKPLSMARTVDIPRAPASLRFFGTAILHAQSEFHATDQVAINYTLRGPRGVCGLISPWNLPLYLFTWKIAPAIATGNTAVGKPSELTPTTATMLAELCQQAGLPPGVLNIVHGTGTQAGAALVKHPIASTISFTGGTVTGTEIAKTTAPLFKKVALELGGKNPTIVFADADPTEAVAQSVRAAFTNQGQVCLCGSRIFVERSGYDSFCERFVETTKKLKVGDPLEAGTDQGAVISKNHMQKVMSYLQLARDEGGTLLCGGHAATPPSERCRDGYFIEPTVVTDLPVNCRVNREEVFGPLVSITPFDSEDEVVGYANDTLYGLSGSVWTKDVSRAHRVAERLQCGTVWVNCWMVRDLRVPFGGMKQSGVGREGGQEAIRFFTEPKNVCIKMA
ncbi:MAG: aldehyde dehydrogenase [Planctomycetota bacterium]